MRWSLSPALPVALLLALQLSADGTRPPPWLPRHAQPGPPVRLSAAEAIAGSAHAPPGAGAFRRAAGHRDWRFPRDHGQHPAYKLEWWYYTGIVRTAEGRPFGFQVTVFRQGVGSAANATDPQRPSAWAVRSLYLGHAALSDIAARRFLHAGRAGRDSLALAGAALDRAQVWLGDWRVDPLPDDPHGVRIAVDAGSFALALELRAQGPPVLHGAGGLDRKGGQPGEASWYYSLPRLATTGTVTLDGAALPVTGATWMDHEFGTSQLAPELVGWDWLALRLDDGSALMLYRLRRADGSASPFSGGTFLAADGRRSALDFAPAAPPPMTPGRSWRSAATGGVYPLEWDVALPAQGLRLHVAPAFDAQEQSAAPGTPFAYWEGAVWASGTRAGKALRGEGYLELTGYAGALGGALR
jgi:predicted secreted hydrolase